MVTYTWFITEPALPPSGAGDCDSTAPRGNRVGNLTSKQGSTDICALPGMHPAGDRRLPRTRCFGQGRLRSRSDHGGVDQPALRRLRAPKSGQGEVDWEANGMAADRYRSRAAYPRCGQIASRMTM